MPRPGLPRLRLSFFFLVFCALCFLLQLRSFDRRKLSLGRLRCWTRVATGPFPLGRPNQTVGIIVYEMAVGS